jgi:branched-chain amino acid transport system ATP-binding protein
MPPAAERLRAENISVRFGGVNALEDVDLDICKGEIVGLIGSNGAGKSTLINVLSGFQRPSAGTVHLGSLSLTSLPPHRIARAGVVRTFQSVRLFRGLTVSENVAAVAAKGRARAGDIIDTLGLADHGHRLAGALPYAHQRRLAIARALALEPDFLLLDEPAAGMTPEEVADVDQILVSLLERTGMGLLVVEHNMTLVMALCNRLVVLDGGRVIARGAPEAVRADPTVQRAYLGQKVGRLQ